MFTVLQSPSLIKKIILDKEHEAEISNWCLSRKPFCEGHKNTGVKSKAMLLIKLNLMNISPIGFFLNKRLCNRILTPVKIFKAGIEICKRKRKEEENWHLSFKTKGRCFEHWLGDFSFPLSHFYIQPLCLKCWASLQHK